MSYDPATLNYDRPFTEWGPAEIDAFPQLVEYVATVGWRTATNLITMTTGMWSPLGLASLGFDAFMRIALTVDITAMPPISARTRAGQLLLNEAQRAARRTPA